MECRKIQSIWFYIKRIIKPKYGRRSSYLKDLMQLDLKDKYFWHDSFGKYINRYILCRVIGHRKVHWLSEGSCDAHRPMHYCFNCESEVNPGVDYAKSKN